MSLHDPSKPSPILAFIEALESLLISHPDAFEDLMPFVGLAVQGDPMKYHPEADPRRSNPEGSIGAERKARGGFIDPTSWLGLLRSRLEEMGGMMDHAFLVRSLAHYVQDWVKTQADCSAGSPVKVAATALLPEEISRLLAPLDEREREIITLRFGLDRGEPRTLEEVAECVNLTRERIGQFEARALSKLRQAPPQVAVPKPPTRAPEPTTGLDTRSGESDRATHAWSRAAGAWDDIICRRFLNDDDDSPSVE
jgi:RNA polymerase sigma factor (sigma-70 family)